MDAFGFQSGGISPADLARITTLENNEYKITYYEIISGASGSITLPTGATVNAGEFGLSGNCVLSKIDGSNKPTFESPKTAGGVVVTSSLNVSNGAWVASGVYTDASVALIYSIKIKAINYGNLTYANIIETVELTDFPISQTITDGDTTHSPSGDAVFDALALKLTASNNLSDVSNPITARNNLKEWDLYLTGGDQSTTSNVASNITNLVTPTLDANKVYAFDIFMRVGCNGSGGVKFQLITPTGSSFAAVIDGVIANNTSRNSQIISTSATLTSLAFITVAGVSFVRINGTLSNGANVGTLQLGFASATNTQTSTIYSLGTYMFVKQLN